MNRGTVSVHASRVGVGPMWPCTHFFLGIT